ncbi:nucleotidyltransferase family protein [Ruminococcaceae bacterium OttesenSCG-928-A16]|nr:nucleotidyltransferase family protein [Ruminococcaceae bacterium OttesenSCG-928-A16]
MPNSKAGTVDAILMASGFSARFGGTNKLAAPFCGVPLVQHTLNLVCGLPVFSNIYFVCANPKVAAMGASYPVQIIHNQNPGRGQRESIRLGVLPSVADYYLFFACDQPLLNAATVQAVLAARKAGHIVQPAYNGQAAGPSLFAKAFRQSLLTLPPGQTGRAIKQQHQTHLLTINLPSPLPLADADTPEELARLEELAGCGSL